MAQKHNSYEEKPMTRFGSVQGPSRRYRRLRNPSFLAAEWTAKNPLLQRGEFGIEKDTHKMKAGDGITYWNDLPYMYDDAGQPLSTADYQMGNAQGGWTTMSQAQQDALNSGATTAKINQIATNTTNISNHIADTNNPHSVTKSQVGLGNVDNTSDLDKPISTATQTALDGKVDKNAAIVGATHTKITYDNKGLVTGGSDITLSDVTDITATAAEVNVLDGITATTTELNYVDGVTSNIQSQLDGKQATISDLSTIRSGAALGATAVQPGDLATVATSGDYDDLLNKPTIGNATLTVQKNGTDLDTFTANATTDKTINITVPVTAADVNALPDSTKYVANASMTINSTTYVVTLQLKDQDGNNIGTAQTIDLPLESVVVSGSYDSATKEVVLTLQNGSTIRFSVADLVSGLQTEITVNNMLNADLVDDSTSTNKFVTSSDITTWNGKQDALTAGSNITISGTTISATDTTYTGSDGITLTGINFTNSGVRSVATGSTNGTISVNTNGTSADVAVYGLGSAAYTASTSYATSAQGALADTAVQPGDLSTVATTGDYDDLLNKPTIPAAQVNSDWNANSGVAQILNKPTLAAVATSGNYSDLVGAPNLATVATTGDYDDLINKPTIPTVNNPTITITQGGVTKGSFTLNQASGDTIALDAGGSTYSAGNGIDITSNVISVDDLDCGTM